MGGVSAHEAPLPIDGLPGADLVTEGIADLRNERDTAPAALVRMASQRLRALGLEVPMVIWGDEPASHHLYDLLAAEDSRGAHSRYNALVRRMVSFARAAEHARTR
jgi:hypothetical protein